MSSPSPPPSVCSSRLSSLARSPTPPSELGYPSPLSSQLSSLGSTPSPDGMDAHRRRDNDVDDDDDSSPPAKRRKVEAKPRTTEFLDLSSSASDEAQKTQLDKLLKVLYKKRKIVVVAGAGISVSAGSMYPPAKNVSGRAQSLTPTQFPTSAPILACSRA